MIVCLTKIFSALITCHFFFCLIAKRIEKALSDLQLRVLQLFTLLYNFLYAFLAYVNCALLLSFEHVSPAALHHQKAALPVHLWQLQAQRKHSLWKCWFNVAGDKCSGRSGFAHFDNWRKKGWEWQTRSETENINPLFSTNPTYLCLICILKG